MTELRVPRVLRANRSGLWIGYLVGEGDLPETIAFEGRRVWSWAGNRLEASQIATQGVTADDKIGDLVKVSVRADDIIDLIETSEETVAAAFELGIWTGS